MIAWEIVITIGVVSLIGICGALVGRAETLKYKCAELEHRYIALEEWAEDWLKCLEQKCEANTDQIAKLAAKIVAMEELLPKTGNGEVVRHQVLLQQLNDEMEKNLRMEREWNEGVAAILNYGKPITEVNNNE